MTGKSLTLIFGAVLVSIPAMAHHNPAAHYIVDERIELDGVVTEFRPVNPHSRIYFEVTNEQGETESWMAEGDSIINLRRSGWTNDQFKPGDRVHILGRPVTIRIEPGGVDVHYATRRYGGGWWKRPGRGALENHRGATG